MIDVAKAVLEVLNNSKTMGKTYELVGPKQYNMKQFCNTISNILIEHPKTYTMGALPANIYRLISDFIIRKPYFNSEAVAIRELDILPTSSSHGRVIGNPSDIIKEELTTLEDVSLAWLRRYRRPQHLNLVEDEEFSPNPDIGLNMIGASNVVGRR